MTTTPRPRLQVRVVQPRDARRLWAQLTATSRPAADGTRVSRAPIRPLSRLLGRVTDYTYTVACLAYLEHCGYIRRVSPRDAMPAMYAVDVPLVVCEVR